MATNEPEDRIAEELERQLQLALTAAAIAVQRVVTARREALLEAERQSAARAQALRAGLAREQAMAQAQIEAVFDPAWWEQATPQDIASMWEQAAQWQEQASPGSAQTFHDATERINSEVSERWGVDVAELVALAELQELDRRYETAVEERERPASEQPAATLNPPRADADDERIATATAAHDERTAAGVTQTSSTREAADQYPATVERQPARMGEPRERFDRRQRRERLGEDLRQAGVPEDAVEARTLADIGQGHEPTEATRRSSIGGLPIARSAGRARTRPAQRHR